MMMLNTQQGLVPILSMYPQPILPQMVPAIGCQILPYNLNSFFLPYHPKCFKPVGESNPLPPGLSNENLPLYDNNLFSHEADKESHKIGNFSHLVNVLNHPQSTKIDNEFNEFAKIIFNSVWGDYTQTNANIAPDISLYEQGKINQNYWQELIEEFYCYGSQNDELVVLLNLLNSDKESSRFSKYFRPDDLEITQHTSESFGDIQDVKQQKIDEENTHKDIEEALEYNETKLKEIGINNGIEAKSRMETHSYLSSYKERRVDDNNQEEMRENRRNNNLDLEDPQQNVVNEFDNAILCLNENINQILLSNQHLEGISDIDTTKNISHETESESNTCEIKFQSLIYDKMTKDEQVIETLPPTNRSKKKSNRQFKKKKLKVEQQMSCNLSTEIQSHSTGNDNSNISQPISFETCEDIQKTNNASSKIENLDPRQDLQLSNQNQKVETDNFPTNPNEWKEKIMTSMDKRLESIEKMFKILEEDINHNTGFDEYDIPEMLSQNTTKLSKCQKKKLKKKRKKQDLKQDDSPEHIPTPELDNYLFSFTNILTEDPMVLDKLRAFICSQNENADLLDLELATDEIHKVEEVHFELEKAIKRSENFTQEYSPVNYGSEDEEDVSIRDITKHSVTGLSAYSLLDENFKDFTPHLTINDPHVRVSLLIYYIK